MIPISSLKLYKYRSLSDRLPTFHPQYSTISDHLNRLKFGQIGEENLTYYLNLASIDSHIKIKGLRIEHKSPFQIDWLFLHTGFRLLLEVKNMTGSMYFDPHSRQLIRMIEENKEVFPDPLFQVDVQHSQLRRFLTHHQQEHLPTFAVAVFVNRNGELNLRDYPERQRILTSQAVPNFIEKLAAKHPSRITTAQNKQFAKWLETHHREPFYPILNRYGIKMSELIKGVRCSVCGRLGMQRVRRRWECPYCHQRNNKDHLQTLTELAMLTENRITNTLAREFLGIDSAEIMKKLLQRGPFKCIGKNKGAYYQHIDLIPFFYHAR